jgi:NADH:ubiquinone oxidoreductase subunit B-like Fe-S oxidoreductase
MYNVEDGLDRYIPVDVYIPGCASHPEQIIDGVAQGIEILGKKSREFEMAKKLMKKPQNSDSIERSKLVMRIGDE